MDRHRRGNEPDLGAFLWMLWEGSIRPRLISRAEIDSLATAMVARHGERAAEMAFIEEDRAWRHSRPFEQGKWRRVRKGIERLVAKKRTARGGTVLEADRAIRG